MQEAVLIFSHQLFENNPIIQKNRIIIFLEHPLFFGDSQYPASFHKQKIIFHRASLKCLEKSVREKGYKTFYLEASNIDLEMRSLISLLEENKVQKLHVIEMDDYILDKRIKKLAAFLHLPLFIHESPGFLSSIQNCKEVFNEKDHCLFSTFYINQRRQFNILLDERSKPIGNKWSFDVDNRKKPPKNMVFPEEEIIQEPQEVLEAKQYVEKNYSKNPGDIGNFNYPVNHADAKNHLKRFLTTRLSLFGDFEDAMLMDQRIVFHSVLSPLLNAGLLTPKQVVEETLSYAEENLVSLNSLEGFIRQVIGWREYVRGIYHVFGTKQRTSNFFGHTRKIPSSFYDGTTGILPLDHCIQKAQSYAYLHHIERLMVVGNFFILCEIHPDEVYKWFMEMFIDSYDWVMVPNIYGMSQYADGGIMTTKPYFSGSNYILKMSDYPKGEWTNIWDALFWRFMKKNISFFENQPRLKILCGMAKQKSDLDLEKAERFLESLSKS